MSLADAIRQAGAVLARSAGGRSASYAAFVRDAVADLVFPRICVVCSALMSPGAIPLACGRCWGCVVPLPHPRCDRCGHPTGEGSCRWCPLLPPFVRAVRSVTWVPGGVAERLVYALKYEGWHRVADEVAERMARLSWPADVVAERAALVPVPLSAQRLRERGYNQSAALASALGRRQGIPVWPDVLERTRATPSQTRLTAEQRLHNVAGAFQVTPGAPSQLDGAHVILVDDVVTTAATLNECAATLWNGGARVISYVTFGRARAAGDAPLSRG